MEVQQREPTQQLRSRGEWGGNKQEVDSQRFRRKRIGRVGEFNEIIPTDGGNKPISSADQIDVWAAGAAPLLAEEEERRRCLVL